MADRLRQLLEEIPDKEKLRQVVDEACNKAYDTAVALAHSSHLGLHMVGDLLCVYFEGQNYEGLSADEEQVRADHRERVLKLMTAYDGLSKDELAQCKDTLELLMSMLSVVANRINKEVTRQAMSSMLKQVMGDMGDRTIILDLSDL